VSRGAKRALIIVDMPFMSYQQSPAHAFASAGRLMQKGGAQVVKLEGGEPMAETVRFLVERGVPVCAHLGLTPQSVHQLGGYRVQGKSAEEAQRLLQDAQLLQQAGAGLLVLELVPAALAHQITAAIDTPTIGIGAGPHCAGQVLVLHDMLGIYPGKTPRFVRNFMHGAQSVQQALEHYVAAVKAGTFPAAEHSF
jgi:3-methyl-2-oxobutanoate hydroxymethyltransferase